MQQQKFDPQRSKGIIWRIGLLMLIVVAGLLAIRKHVSELYFGQTLTGTGLLVNGAIVALFLTGITVIIIFLNRLSKEEQAIDRFSNNVAKKKKLLDGIPVERLIAQRYIAAEQQHRKSMPVNHGALAQIMVANESSRLGLVRFINNILILTGVFGTIVSLSIALIGASDMLNPNSDMSGMTTVIQGMSTALSTTITAIVCFIIFGYAMYKTNDAQTRVFAAIETATIDHLLPQFHISDDNANGEMKNLIRSLTDVVSTMQKMQSTAGTVEEKIAEGLMTHDQRMLGLVGSIRNIEASLKPASTNSQ